MHQHAIDAGVPLRALSALEDQGQQQDFAVDAASNQHYAAMVDLWKRYASYVVGFQIPGAVESLGLVLNQHMRAYYAWRFQAMRSKQAARSAGRTPAQDQQVIDQERTFAADRAAIERELKAAREALYNAQKPPGGGRASCRTVPNKARCVSARHLTPPPSAGWTWRAAKPSAVRSSTTASVPASPQRPTTAS